MVRTQKFRIIGGVFLLFIFFLVYQNNLKETPELIKEQKENSNITTCHSKKVQNISLFHP